MSLNPIDILAAARLVRLVRVDRVTEPLREALIHEGYIGRAAYEPLDVKDPETWVDRALLDEDPPMIAELLGCSWCLGLWAMAFVLVARRVAPRSWDPMAKLLAGSLVASVIELGADRA